MDTEKEYNNLVISHYIKNWGTDFQIMRYKKGPMKTLSKEFCVLEYPPGNNRKMWTYATCGMSSTDDRIPIELHLFSAIQDQTIIEILTAVSYYHKKTAKLNLNHTVNFGIPWQADSKCSFGLISLPYLDGPRLEVLEISPLLTVRFYWLIPITPEERAYKIDEGIEALETKFEEYKLDYSNPHRESVVMSEP